MKTLKLIPFHDFNELSAKVAKLILAYHQKEKYVEQKLQQLNIPFTKLSPTGFAIDQSAIPPHIINEALSSADYIVIEALAEAGIIHTNTDTNQISYDNITQIINTFKDWQQSKDNDPISPYNKSQEELAKDINKKYNVTKK